MLIEIIDETLTIMISAIKIDILLIFNKLFIEIFNLFKNVYFNSYSI